MAPYSIGLLKVDEREPTLLEELHYSSFVLSLLQNSDQTCRQNEKTDHRIAHNILK